MFGRPIFTALKAAIGTTVFAIQPERATNSNSDDYAALGRKYHPPKPDEESFARARSSHNECEECHKTRVAKAKFMSQLFSKLKVKKAEKILEIGIGNGRNLGYYARDPGLQVIAIDPNAKMEKHARSAAESAGLPLSNFEFIHGVGEVIPLSDASVDAVVGTHVLCCVKDVDLTLKEIRRVLRPGGVYIFMEHVAAKDWTFDRFLQAVLNPLNKIMADGCHLSRETGNNISRAGFSNVEQDMIVLISNPSFCNPIIYGIAYK